MGSKSDKVRDERVSEESSSRGVGVFQGHDSRIAKWYGTLETLRLKFLCLTVTVPLCSNAFGDGHARDCLIAELRGMNNDGVHGANMATITKHTQSTLLLIRFIFFDIKTRSKA